MTIYIVIKQCDVTLLNYYHVYSIYIVIKQCDVTLLNYYQYIIDYIIHVQYIYCY